MKYMFVCSQVLLLITVTGASAQESKQENFEQGRIELLKQYYRSFAKSIEFATTDGMPMTLVSAPVLSWTGQEGQSRFTSGDVFIWERNGRPEVVGCIGSIPANVEQQRFVFQEFHSLSTKPMQPTKLEYGGPWGAEKAGVDLQDVQTDLVPSKSAALRLAQMRKIASSFTGFMRWPDQAREERMRLVRQPLYRFDTKKLAKLNSDVVDGALFAFVWSSGTDPDILLLVESRRELGELNWKFGVVRFTSRFLRLEYGGKEVWKVGQDHGSPTSAYRLASVGNITYDQMREFMEMQKADGDSTAGNAKE